MNASQRAPPLQGKKLIIDSGKRKNLHWALFEIVELEKEKIQPNSLWLSQEKASRVLDIPCDYTDMHVCANKTSCKREEEHAENFFKAFHCGNFTMTLKHSSCHYQLNIADSHAPWN